MALKFKPKIDKIVELLLYLAHRRPNADKYQAVKFFYLADREHLNRYGRPITSEVYYALEYGPVASIAMDLIENEPAILKSAGLKQLPFETEALDKIIYIRKPLRAVNYDLFSKSDLKIFDEIIEKYGKMSFDELYKITHQHFAYTNVWNRRPKNMNRAKMNYEDMIEEGAKKADLLEDISPVSANM
jgi:uncharacterized phage-associated protein